MCSAVIRLSAPASSSGPQRPQFLTDSNIARSSSLLYHSFPTPNFATPSSGLRRPPGRLLLSRRQDLAEVEIPQQDIRDEVNMGFRRSQEREFRYMFLLDQQLDLCATKNARLDTLRPK